MEKKSLENTIENWVRERRTTLATQAIKKYLKGSQQSLNAKIQACDWYRRLGKFWEAYRLIAPDEYKVRSTKQDQALIRQYLWTSRMLNLLGASNYALTVAELIQRAHSAEDCKILANIYFSNFNSEKALQYFLKMEELEKDPDSYSSRLARIGTCDALASVGKTKEALKKLRTIKVYKNETLLQGILYQVQGEYLARAGAYQQALKPLKLALKYFKKDDETVDYAFLLKWIAISHAGLGEDKEAVRLFNQVIQILKKPKHRPESWLDVFYWMDHFHLLSPQRKKTLLAYPGLNHFFLSRIPQETSLQLGPAKNDIWISEASQEWRHGEQYFSQIPKEVQLLGLVARAGSEGISIFRLLPLIWVDDLSIHLHVHRLTQIRREVQKKFNISIKIIDQVLSLSEEDAKKVSVEVWNSKPKPSVFFDRNQASFLEIQKHYSIKRTQSHHLVKKWENGGIVKLSKIGREVIIKPI